MLDFLIKALNKNLSIDKLRILRILPVSLGKIRNLIEILIIM